MAKSKVKKLKIPQGILGKSSGSIENIIVQGEVIRIKPDNKTK
jgi:hypothetical protein